MLKKISVYILMLFCLTGLVGCKSDEYEPMKSDKIVETYDDDVKKLIEKYYDEDDIIGISSIEVCQVLSKEAFEGFTEITIYFYTTRLFVEREAEVRWDMLNREDAERYYFMWPAETEQPTEVERIENGSFKKQFSDEQDLKVKRLGDNYYQISYFMNEHKDFYSMSYYLYSYEELEKYREYFDELKNGY